MFYRFLFLANFIQMFTSNQCILDLNHITKVYFWVIVIQMSWKVYHQCRETGRRRVCVNASVCVCVPIWVAVCVSMFVCIASSLVYLSSLDEVRALCCHTNLTTCVHPRLSLAGRLSVCRAHTRPLLSRIPSV